MKRLDGKHTTHGTTIVLYQCNDGVEPLAGTFGHTNEPSSNPYDRSMKSLIVQRAQTDYQEHCRHLNSNDYFGKIRYAEWFQTYSAASDNAPKSDMAWMLMRLLPVKLGDVDIFVPNNQKVPSWSGFIAMISTRIQTLPQLDTDLSYQSHQQSIVPSTQSCRSHSECWLPR